MAQTTTPANAQPRSASYAGHCAICRHPFPAGTKIMWARGYTAHVRCPLPTKKATPARDSAAPSAVFVAIAPILAALAAAQDAAKVALPAAEAALVAAKTAWRTAVTAAGACLHCNGTHRVTCSACAGRGYVQVMSDMYETCPATVACGCSADAKSVTAVAHDPTVVVATAALSAARADHEKVSAAAVGAAIRALREPQRGTKVVVARGRKVAKGTVGVVVWAGQVEGYSGGSSYWRRSHYGVRGAPMVSRVGVQDAAGVTHWTSASNVDVIEVPAATVAQYGF